MIILPKGYDPAKWQSTFIGTGPFKLGSYTPKSGATFTRNESYWGKKALPSQTQFTFYDTQNPSILALTGGTIDVVGQFAVAGARGTAHRQLQHHQAEVQRAPPAVDAQRPGPVHRPAGPAGDRAHARPAAIVKALFKGYADVGNDSPFAPVFPSTNTSIAAADAGHRQGQVAAGRGRARLGVQHPAGHRELRRDPPVRPDRGRSRPRQIGVNISLKVEELEPVLRQGHVRELRLAGRHHEPGRLRAPRRAERVPRPRRSQTTTPRRGPARGTPPTSPTRSTTSWWRSTSPPRPGHAEDPRRADRDAAAGRRRRSSSGTSTIT